MRHEKEEKKVYVAAKRAQCHCLNAGFMSNIGFRYKKFLSFFICAVASPANPIDQTVVVCKPNNFSQTDIRNFLRCREHKMELDDDDDDDDEIKNRLDAETIKIDSKPCFPFSFSV